MIEYKYTCYFAWWQESEEVVEFNEEPTEEELLQDCKDWAYWESDLEYHFEKIEDD